MNCINANDQWLDIVPAGGIALGVTRRVANKAATTGLVRTAPIDFAVDPKQARHVPGAMPGRSELTHPDPQALINRYAHTGQAVDVNKERVVADELIGFWVDQSTGVRMPTSVAMIHYSSKNGTAHVIPARPLGLG